MTKLSDGEDRVCARLGAFRLLGSFRLVVVVEDVFDVFVAGVLFAVFDDAAFAVAVVLERKSGNNVPFPDSAARKKVRGLLMRGVPLESRRGMDNSESVDARMLGKGRGLSGLAALAALLLLVADALT
jgi:hypothetical protein